MSLNQPSDDNIFSGLKCTEESFLHAIVSGNNALQKFASSFSKLHSVTNEAIEHGTLSEGIRSYAHTLCSNIAIIAQGFIDTETAADSISTELVDDLSQALNDMSLTSKPTVEREESSDPKSLSQTDSLRKRKVKKAMVEPIPSSSQSSDGHPQLSSRGYAWLKDHLHSPYPSRSIKAEMADASNTSVENVNSWFANARRRIGWTTIRNQYFRHDRLNMLDCAYRALVEEDPSRPVPRQTLEDFQKMKEFALEVCSGKAETSQLALKIDTLAERVWTEQTKDSAKSRSRRGSEAASVDVQKSTECEAGPSSRKCRSRSRESSPERASTGTCNKRRRVHGAKAASSDEANSIVASPASELDLISLTASPAGSREMGSMVEPRSVTSQRRKRSRSSEDSDSARVTREVNEERTLKRSRVGLTSHASFSSFSSNSTSDSEVSTPGPSSPPERIQDLATPYVNVVPGYEFSDFYSNTALHDWTSSVSVDPLQDIQACLSGYAPAPALTPAPTAPPVPTATFDLPLPESDINQAALDEILSGFDFTIPEDSLFGFGEEIPGIGAGDLEFSTADYSQILNMSAPVTTGTSGANLVTDFFLDPVGAFSSTRAVLNDGFFDDEYLARSAAGPSLVEPIVFQSAMAPSMLSAALTAPVV